MWMDEVSTDSVLENNSSQLCDLIDELIDAPALAEAMESGSWRDRKDVCQFLGIAPSTLSGWEKDNRIPRAAKLALGLTVSVEKLKRLLKAKEDDWSEPQVILDGARWMIVRHKRDADGLWTGEVLGEAKSEQLARRFAGVERSLKLLKEAESIIKDTTETFDNDAFMADVMEHQERTFYHVIVMKNLEAFRKFKSDQRAFPHELLNDPNSTEDPNQKPARSANIEE